MSGSSLLLPAYQRNPNGIPQSSLRSWRYTSKKRCRSSVSVLLLVDWQLGQRYPSVLSPKPLRANTTGTNSTPSPLPTQPSVTTAPPSYQGPGVTFEKGEDFPTHETPALPTEEERDVLET